MIQGRDSQIISKKSISVSRCQSNTNKDFSTRKTSYRRTGGKKTKTYILVNWNRFFVTAFLEEIEVNSFQKKMLQIERETFSKLKKKMIIVCEIFSVLYEGSKNNQFNRCKWIDRKKKVFLSIETNFRINNGNHFMLSL